MILEAIIGKGLVDVYRSIKMDEKALSKYAQAYEKSEKAVLIVKERADKTDKRLQNVVKKKRAIKEFLLPRFANVFQTIRKLELDNSSRINEVAITRKGKDSILVLEEMIQVNKKDYSDKEYLCGMLFHGFTGMMLKDSKKFISAANSQMRAANVQYMQAESIIEVLDAIEKRADRISTVLSTFNYLLSSILDEVERIIVENGDNIDLYSDYEIGVVVTCENIVIGLSEIFDVPVINEKGEIVEKAEEMIISSEKFVKQMQEALL